MLEKPQSGKEIRHVTLDDRYDLVKKTVLLNGTQALIRMLLNQKARDIKAGLNTAGYVTGYRGSPLGGVDMHISRELNRLSAADIVFHPGLNEDIAATAIWGTQQAELRGEGKFDGVFGLWYGKGPGVDRSGDVLRHANMSGTSKYGGVVLALGDDHTGESSTTLHQSDMAMLDYYIPVLSPAGVQEVLDYGVIGYALSRFSGNWVGMKCVKETIESTAVVDANPHRLKLQNPVFDLPQGGLNIRLWDTPKEREERIIDYRRYAAEAFAEVNQLNQRVYGTSKATIGLVAAGKNWLDLVHALELLDLDDKALVNLGITAYKVGMTWPLAHQGFIKWAKELDLIIVFEEKRKLIEAQVKEALFSQLKRYRVLGHRDSQGDILLSAKYELNPFSMAKGLGRILCEEGLETERLASAITKLNEHQATANLENIVSRTPYFCSGCPHNTSTKIPEGSRAYSGIGCHYMVQWMDRDTLGFTHMGGEGGNWIGEAAFSNTSHVFQNIGDGTYNHSGLQTIRAAVMADVNITYKILYNDAVAMTGGQLNDGNLTPVQVALELLSFGIKQIALIYDAKEDVNPSDYPQSVKVLTRDQLDSVQRQFRDVPGVTAIIYLQTCAAEKRRRRKRGTFPKISQRVFINTDVCEGCGDCGIQSNCVSIVPVETEFGLKRAIDQSSCNLDLSCLNGFCPSFVTLDGAKPKQESTREITIPQLPDPKLPAINQTFNIVITGIGGTGVVTIGAILGMASHLDRKGVGVIEMAGLAQKGGAVSIHCRIANNPEDISAIRVADSEADCIIGGDLIVTASSDCTRLLNPHRSKVVINSSTAMPGEFTRDTDFTIPKENLVQRIEAAVDSKGFSNIDASELARSFLGNSIYSNMIILGFAWQKGYIPLSYQALARAIELNGAYPDKNILALQVGRWAAEDSSILTQDCRTEKNTTDSVPSDLANFFHERLCQYQNQKLADRYQTLIDKFKEPVLRDIVAKSYYKVLAIKDEYEIARLHLNTTQHAEKFFSGIQKVNFYLSPPLIARKDSNGQPKKYKFGPWVIHIFRVLSFLKGIRGTAIDPFKHLAERKLQKQLIQFYEDDIEIILRLNFKDVPPEVVELAGLPLKIRGYGHVWEHQFNTAMRRRDELLKQINQSHSNQSMDVNEVG